MAGGMITKSKNRSSRRRRNHTSAMAEINVTPFVDVMLVLLIIFMVAAPLLTVGIPVELPKTSAASLPDEQEEPLTITLTKTGEIVLMTTPLEAADLLTRLEAIASERQSRKIFLRADGNVPYAKVAQLMGMLNAGGFNQIGLVTDSDSRPALNTGG